MSDLQIIETALARAARRHRWSRAVNGLGLGLLAGALVFLLALIAFKLLPVPPWILSTAGVVAAILVLAGFIWGAWRKMSLIGAARWADDRKGFKERLSTALEMPGCRVPEDWKQLVLADAARHAESLNSKELIQIGFPRAAR